MPAKDFRGTFEERFWKKVQKSDDGCWLWTGAVTKGKDYGYGYIGRDGGNVRTNRASWEIHFGPIPEGKWVLHTCDVRHCVRPDHLFLGTHDDNMKDMAAKGRATGHGQSGELCGHNKLTGEQVIQIRKLAGTMFQWQIAEKYGITQANVHLIITCRIWRHVEGKAYFAGRPSKLNSNQVREIRKLRGTMSHSQIAARYGVTTSNIQQILAGKTWTHVTD